MSLKKEDIHIREVPEYKDNTRMVATLQVHASVVIDLEVYYQARERTEASLRQQIANKLYGDIRAAAREAMEEVIRNSTLSNYEDRLERIEKLFQPLLNAGKELVE